MTGPADASEMPAAAAASAAQEAAGARTPEGPAPQSAQAPAAAGAGPEGRQDAAAASRWGWVALAAVVLVGGSVGAARLIQVQRAMQQLRQQSQDLGAQHQRDLGQIREFEERMEATARRTEQLEQELTVFAGRDVTGDADLRRLREQSVLAEVDELLTLAASQLQISHDPTAAAAALGTADARLARLPRAQFIGLREALARDMERLRKSPVPDLTGMAIRIDRLVQGVDSWHLLADPARKLAVAPPRAKAEAAPAGRLSWIGREFGDTFRDLVRIRTVDAPEALLMPADQHQLVREHVRVRLLGARQAMLLRNDALFRSDLSDCQALIGRYFDPGDPLVGAALAQLRTMAAAAIDVPVPGLEDSQAALRSARPSAP